MMIEVHLILFLKILQTFQKLFVQPNWWLQHAHPILSSICLAPPRVIKPIWDSVSSIANIACHRHSLLQIIGFNKFHRFNKESVLFYYLYWILCSFAFRFSMNLKVLKLKNSFVLFQVCKLFLSEIFLITKFVVSHFTTEFYLNLFSVSYFILLPRPTSQVNHQGNVTVWIQYQYPAKSETPYPIIKPSIWSIPRSPCRTTLTLPVPNTV